MIKVPGYGLYTDENLGVKWLVQNSAPYNAVGLSNNDCPFQITSGYVKCPHNFDMTKTTVDAAFEDKLDKFKDEPIMRHMSPVPFRGQKHIFVNSTHPATMFVVANLLSMRSLLVPTIHALGEVRPAQVASYLNGSNLSCCIVSGVHMDTQYDMRQMIEQTIAIRGLLVFVGQDVEMYGYEHFIPKVPMCGELFQFMNKADDLNEQLRRYGALQLREYMKRGD